MNISTNKLLFVLLAVSIALSACTTSKKTIEGNFSRSSVSAASIVADIPNYYASLNSARGKGRAIVSEPGNSDRVTIAFQTTKELSLLTFQNRIGIEGGKMLVDADSILIYDKLEKRAQKISIYDGRMTSLNELASINILDLLNFKVKADEVNSVRESNKYYQLRLKNGAEVYVQKESGLVQQVIHTQRGYAPYSKIQYESYGELQGFTLPRKITIFSADGDSRVLFLIRSLNINPKKLNLELNIPNDMVIQRL